MSETIEHSAANERATRHDETLYLRWREAPHECSDPNCPGNVNRLKLESYDNLLLRLHTLQERFDAVAEIAEQFIGQREKLREERDEAFERNRSLERRCVKAEIKRDKFEPERDRLREASQKIFDFIEDGTLVRNIENDGSPDWAMRALPLVRAMQELGAALTPEEET